MTFPADRRIATRFGLLDVDLEMKADGRCIARLARPEDHPRLSAVTASFGADEDEAVARLAGGIDRFGAEEPAQPRPPARP